MRSDCRLISLVVHLSLTLTVIAMTGIAAASQAAAQTEVPATSTTSRRDSGVRLAPGAFCPNPGIAANKLPATTKARPPGSVFSGGSKSHYNRRVKTWDVVIIGGGVVGLSLAWRLRREGASVMVVEKGEPGREATYAAGGMIAHCDANIPAALQEIAKVSARMYPEFVRELRAEAFESPDLRDKGTLAFREEGELPSCEGARPLEEAELTQLEPLIARRGRCYWLPERSVDPRKLASGLDRAARTLGVDFATGAAVTEVAVLGRRVTGVRTSKSFYAGAAVVSCAGAWASQMKPLGIPTRPVKGQMVCVVPKAARPGVGPLIQHVLRTPEVYIIPRTDGRMLLGATVEEAGYDKRVDTDTVQRLHKAAIEVAPEIANMRIHDAWAGLRPASPDGLPILGQTSLPGYYAATGHYRDGIMLAPVTALVMTQVLTGRKPDFSLEAFSPLRFG
jgi:glycine oxidase